ncbi:serine/threonine-protein kinase [Crateriforma conspicua]|uniref:Serine/threonine-protein kinase PknD n=1 Tax=Crateriforma conspicua TaxID=2527996 RepID=A0A5C5Y829_9PLAN|nr:serine/threonine-protein kinase [Crateriforma conspicua]TWT71118.1 Serine/threonine-protein kinase PknD [Crateriforma conspicua]
MSSRRPSPPPSDATIGPGSAGPIADAKSSESPADQTKVGGPPSRSSGSGEKASYGSGASRRPRRSARHRKRQTGSDASAKSSLKGEPVLTGDSQPATNQRYRITGEIGRGGWGVVQRAFDRQLQRTVAIKRITESANITATVRQRFLHEARITSQLQHPGIVPVHELDEGQAGSHASYVMKLLDGHPLRQSIRDTHASRSAQYQSSTWSHREAILPLLERFIDVCEAVAYAHQQGVIHRDLKPANVMVGRFGETIVVDWGLAKRIDGADAARDVSAIESDLNAAGDLLELPIDDSARTTAGAVVGTPAYMSPEQACGQTDTLTAATDIYSLGVMLHEIAVGRHPFAGQGVDDVLTAVRAGRWDAARLRCRHVPRALSAICDTAMQLDPSHRYPTAEALAADVRRFIAGEKVSAHRETTIDVLSRWCRRHRAIAATISIAMAMLLVVALVFGFFIRQAQLNERHARIAAQQSHRNALRRLDQSRRAADAWLIDLSGSLQFYPGLDPVRSELIEQAIVHYESLLREEAPTELGPELQLVPVRLQHYGRLQQSKLYLRLSDLHRIAGHLQQADAAYRSAQTVAKSVQSGRLSPSDRIDHRVHRINLDIAQMLIDPETASDIDGHQRWLTWQLRRQGIDNPTSAPGTKQSLDFDLANVLARLHLVACRRWQTNESPTCTGETLTQARLAHQWSAWLSRHRGTAADHRLMETAAVARADALHHLGQLDDERLVWQELIAAMQRIAQDHPNRVDYRQSIAHGRLRLAGLMTDAGGQRSEASQMYRLAIDDLRRSRSLTDGDGFCQTNLAAAEYSLATLLMKADGFVDDQTPPGPSDLEARRLLENSLSRRQRLLQNAPGVRHLSDVAEVLATLTNISNVDPDQRRLWATQADVAYQMLQEHSELTPRQSEQWSTVRRVIDGSDASVETSTVNADEPNPRGLP